MKTIERKITALATTPDLGPYPREQLCGLLPRIADRDRLIELAIREGLAGLFYKNFMKAGLLTALTRRQQETLRSYYYSAVRCNLKLIRECTEILECLNRRGIEVVLLQGMDLLQELYEDVGLRPLTDIDLWVRESDLSHLSRILSGLGYRKDPLYPLTFRKGETVLDIHTHILWADRIRARALLLDQDQETVRKRAGQIVFETLAARCLEPYDRLIYLSLHLLKHHANRLIWMVDIRNLVADWKAAEWEALLARARLMGQGKCIAQTFFLIGRLLEFHVPEEIRAKLAPLHPIEKKILGRRRNRETLPEWATLVLFASGKGLVKGSAFLLESVFPRPAVLRQVFAEKPGSSAFRLYALRIGQIAGMLKSALK